MAPLGSLFRERNEATTSLTDAPLSVTKSGVVDQLDQVAVSVDGAPKKRVHQGDIVINSRSDRKGSAGEAPRDGSVSVINTVLIPERINKRFAHHLIRSTGFQEEFYRFGSGIVADLWSTRWSAMKNISLPVPPELEQKMIADYLDHETAEIDTLIADTGSLVDTVALRRRSLIDRIFMDAEWPEVALKYRGELRSGLTLGKTHDGATESYPYLRVANVQVGRVSLDDIATVDLPIAEAERYRLHEGDVLMTEGGDRDKLGRGAIWAAEIDPMLHQNHVFTFRCGSLLAPEFLVYGLEATPARVYFDQTARQSTNLASTNSTVVKNFRLPMPPLEEQHRVVASLNHELTYMSDMVANAKKVAHLARERRAALITAAATGQIDVTAKNKPAAEQLEDDIAQGLHREN
ncbi:MULTISPECIES: restriction endonuclease subunit S [Kocuria]|uniref:restriction endonuclease subunit S n=1 Tax=Kocuria TaxID=57493 RepID=UPI00143B3266|nr:MULTISPECIES: restriction endonuclease subunit S [Kocuria]MDA4829750.1 restriction endonuclease subunit S [Kocuria rhizophila]